MKQRVITGVLSGIIFIGALLLMNTIVFPIFVALLSGMAVWEIEKAVGLKNKMIMAVSLVLSVAIPFIVHFGVKMPIAAFGGVYVVLIFIFMLLKFETTKFEQAVTAIFASVCVPFSFSLMIVFRDIHMHFEGYTKIDGIYLLLFAFFASWMTDIFAYFVGSKLGKHKLCPKISPKKSVEGAIGGVLGSTLAGYLYGLILVHNEIITNDLIYVFVLLGFFGSMVAQIGDLAASAIKRNYDIKDYGKLIPGHGGIMDRFDSVLVTAPIIYFMFTLLV